MDNKKINFIYELIFTISIIPIMIGAIIKSKTLIGINYDLSFFNSVFMQNNGNLIIYLILIINMIIAIASMLILLINLGLTNKKSPNIPNLSTWANFMIKLCALSNIIVIGFISQAPNILTQIKNPLILWTITFALSILFSLVKNQRKDSNF